MVRTHWLLTKFFFLARLHPQGMQNGQTEPQGPSCIGVDVVEEETRLLTPNLDFSTDVGRDVGRYAGIWGYEKG